MIDFNLLCTGKTQQKKTSVFTFVLYVKSLNFIRYIALIDSYIKNSVIRSLQNVCTGNVKKGQSFPNIYGGILTYLLSENNFKNLMTSNIFEKHAWLDQEGMCKTVMNNI